MITIASSADFMNTVINHPQVKPTACPGLEEFVDFSFIVESDDHFFLECKPHGGFCMQCNDYDSYVVHTAFLPDTPSALVRQAVVEAFDVAFLELDAMEVWTSACSSNVPAMRLCNFAKFKKMFSRPSRIVEGETQTYFRITIDDYTINNLELASLGKKFHDNLGEHISHTHDPSHDAYVGAALTLLNRGNSAKALRVYNKWASVAEYEAIVMDPAGRVARVGNLEITLSEDLTYIEGITCQQEQQ